MLFWLDSVRADAVFGWRQLMKKRVTTSAAVLSLALAIGSCVAAFRLCDALLWRPLPVAHVDRLYSVAFEAAGVDVKSSNYDSCNYPMFRAMRETARDDAELIAASYTDWADVTFGSDEEMEKAYRQFVSGWMFEVFGLQPELGRVLRDEDDRAPGEHPVAVLSHQYWTRRFGQDRNVIGRRFQMEGGAFEVVGVAPEGFTGTETGTMTDIFVPMAMKNPRTLASADNFWLRTLVVLKPGAMAALVREKLAAVHRADLEARAKRSLGLPKQRLERMFREKLLLERAPAGRSDLQRDYGRALAVLGILVALVLLIACANVANLMTARAAARGREMALRVSIGAGRARLVQLVVVESAWIAMLATALGGLLAWRAAPLVAGMIDLPGNPARFTFSADGRMLAFAAVLACCVTLLFGLAPALRASNIKPAGALRGGEDPHSRRRLMRGMIAAQAAFGFVVLLMAGLLAKTFDKLTSQPLGFSPERILNLETIATRPQPALFWEQAAERLRSSPGVESVALAGWPAMSGESSISSVSVGGAPPVEAFSDLVYVSPRWFETMRVPLIDGRDFRAADTAPSVAIVNETFARQYFNGENPVGRWFEWADSAGVRTRVQVVGLARDARSRDNLRLPIRQTAYVPFTRADKDGVALPRSRGTLVVRTASANPIAMASPLRREVPRARPELRVTNIRTQVEIVRSKMVRERLLAVLAMFFAGAALLLAGIGLYGVLDYSVFERRREIGIRMAIGARAGDIGRRVTLDTFAMVLVGSVAGLAIGMATVRSIEALLYHVKATDLGVLAIPSLGIVIVALLAALAPVMRAVRIDPITILRAE